MSRRGPRSCAPVGRLLQGPSQETRDSGVRWLSRQAKAVSAWVQYRNSELECLGMIAVSAAPYMCSAGWTGLEATHSRKVLDYQSMARAPSRKGGVACKQKGLLNQPLQHSTARAPAGDERLPALQTASCWGLRLPRPAPPAQPARVPRRRCRLRRPTPCACGRAAHTACLKRPRVRLFGTNNSSTQCRCPL